MPPRTPLGARSVNARDQKKSNTFRIELSPHKCSVIEELHKAGCSVKDIMEIENTPRSTVRDTLKFLNARPKGQSLPRSGRPSILTRVEKHAIIRFCCENVKATYAEVKQELQLNCSLITIHRIVKKQGIKKWLAKKRPILTKKVAKARLAISRCFKQHGRSSSM
jgi:transposase